VFVRKFSKFILENRRSLLPDQSQLARLSELINNDVTKDEVEFLLESEETEVRFAFNRYPNFDIGNQFAIHVRGI
jgi:hypothetical protein